MPGPSRERAEMLALRKYIGGTQEFLLMSVDQLLSVFAKVESFLIRRTTMLFWFIQHLPTAFTVPYAGKCCFFRVVL